eukprot:115403_1
MALFSLETIPERNALIVSISFFLVFSGWSASSSFATTKNGDVGAISIGIVYLVFTVSNLIALPIITNFSPKSVMFMSAIPYGMYIASNIFLDPINNYYHKLILYFLSSILGFGAACIWICQSMFITECSNQYETQKKLPKNSKLGYFNGIFFMCFLFNRFAGCLISGILFAYQYDESTVFTILSILCFFGCCGFGLISSTKKKKGKKRGKKKRQKNKSTWKMIQLSVVNTVRLWTDFNLICLIGFTMFIGVDSQFNAAVFPLFIKDKSTKMFILSVFGLTASISSLIWGKLSDTILPRLQVLVTGFMCKMAYYSFLYLNKDTALLLYENSEDGTGNNYVLFSLIIGALLMGISNGALLGQLSAIYPILLGKKPEVFANIKLWQSLSAASIFFMHSSLTLELKIKINLILLIVGYLPFVLWDSIRVKLM